jgi:hypothetical protein
LEKANNSISKIKTLLPGIPPDPKGPYPRLDGIIKVPFPPFLSNGMAILHPEMRLVS